MPSIAVSSPTAGARLRGSVDVRVRVTGGRNVESVTVVIGHPDFGTRTATPVGGGEYVVRWNTTRKLSDPTVPAPTDSLFWITARAVVDGVEVHAPYVAATTDNAATTAATDNATTDNAATTADTRLAGGWRPELAWAADYSGSTSRWRRSVREVVGGAYVSVTADPVLGAVRRAARVRVPNSAKKDPDQPNRRTVRFQASSPRVIREGDEFCVGFAFLPPADFPTTYPRDDVTNPRGRRGNGYIAIFQFYGPPYEQGSPFLLHSERRSPTDPVDEFAIRGNELNPGDPAPFLSLPYRRGRWTDVVFRIKASASIRTGWVETYVNQGESTGVRPVLRADGQVRLPRVLLRPNSLAFRTDMQLYRVADQFDSVSMWHTGHKIAATVQEADPRSYRNGARP